MSAASLLKDGPGGKALLLDPRTKLLLVATVAVVLLTGGYGGSMDVVRAALSALPFALLVFSRRFGAAAAYAAALAAVYLLEWAVSPHLSGIPNLIVLVTCATVSRFAPCIALGWYVLSTTTVSELVAALERMRVSQKVVIPLSVMFRFLPTVAEESAAIGDAMRMRGVRLGGGKASSMLEFRLVPLLMSSVKIGDELSAAALTRGLGAPARRTNVCRIGFHAQDAVVWAVCLASLACFAADAVGVL